MVVQAVAAIALGLLGLAGIAKVVDPQPTSGALSSARIPSRLWMVRALGLFELGAAVGGLAIGSRAAVPGALLYLGFTLFTWTALRADLPLQSCGCFGKEDTPPSRFHLGFNAISVVTLTSVAVSGGEVISWGGGTGEVSSYLVFAALGVYAAFLMLTALPQTLALSAR